MSSFLGGVPVPSPTAASMMTTLPRRKSAFRAASEAKVGALSKEEEEKIKQFVAMEKKKDEEEEEEKKKGEMEEKKVSMIKRMD